MKYPTKHRKEKNASLISGILKCLLSTDTKAMSNDSTKDKAVRVT
jgi:hypothetical protein